MTDVTAATPPPIRVRDLPPDSEPFTRCGFTCRYVLPDGSPVTATDADNPGLGIAVRVRVPGRRETFLATIPAAGFRAMDDDEFTHTIAVTAWQAHYGGPIDEADPCGRTSPLGPRELCVLPREHRWGHKSENGAEWVEDGPTYTLPWPKGHRQHPAHWLRRAEDDDD
jgi:hypothetical protein